MCVCVCMCVCEREREASRGDARVTFSTRGSFVGRCHLRRRREQTRPNARRAAAAPVGRGLRQFRDSQSYYTRTVHVMHFPSIIALYDMG